MLYISGKKYSAMEDHESTLQMYVRFTKNRVADDFNAFVEDFRAAIGGLIEQLFWRVTFHYADTVKKERFIAIARQSNKSNYQALKRFEYRAPPESCLHKCWNQGSNSICEQKYEPSKGKTLADWIKDKGFNPESLNMKSDHLDGWRLKSLRNGKGPERDGAYQGVIIFEIEGKDVPNFKQIIETPTSRDKAKALRKAMWDLSRENLSRKTY